MVKGDVRYRFVIDMATLDNQMYAYYVISTLL